MPEPDRALADELAHLAAEARHLAQNGGPLTAALMEHWRHVQAVAALLPAAPAPPQGAEDLARDVAAFIDDACEEAYRSELSQHPYYGRDLSHDSKFDMMSRAATRVRTLAHKRGVLDLAARVRQLAPPVAGGCETCKARERQRVGPVTTSDDRA